MCRVEATTRHIAARWRHQATLQATAAAPELQEGLAAYTFRHVHMEEGLASKWVEQWRQGKAHATPILAGNMGAAEEAEKLARTDKLIQIELEDDSPPGDDEY